MPYNNIIVYVIYYNILNHLANWKSLKVCEAFDFLQIYNIWVRCFVNIKTSQKKKKKANIIIYTEKKYGIYALHTENNYLDTNSVL